MTEQVATDIASILSRLYERSELLGDCLEEVSNTDVLLLVGLDSSDLLPVQSPAILSYNLGMSREHASRRLARLSDNGYVTKIEDGKYSVSGRGEAFLAGIPDGNG